MSFVIAVPEIMTDAVASLESLGSSISEAHAVVAAPTTGLLAAGADEVSAAIATVLSEHGSAYQALSAQAAAFHAQFLQTLNAGSSVYAATEAANSAPLRTLERDALGVINAPTDALLGRPLIGDGTNGITNADGMGTAGGAGGILVGQRWRRWRKYNQRSARRCRWRGIPASS
jgi:hypothetical protein